jgi:hypothetical protein
VRLQGLQSVDYGRGKEGEWGVKGEGKCGAVSGRGGVIGVAGARGGGGGGGAQSGFRRKKTAGLTDRVGPLSVRGRRRADWARKGGRRWAAVGWKRSEEVGPKPLLRLKFKRVKENKF